MSISQVRALQVVRQVNAIRLRSTQLAQRARYESTYQAPTPPQKPQANLHRSFYRNQGYPVFKAVLIAVTTYELLYWGWLKLESLEVKAEAEGEIRDLQNQLKSLVQKKGTSG